MKQLNTDATPFHDWPVRQLTAVLLRPDHHNRCCSTSQAAPKLCCCFQGNSQISIEITNNSTLSGVCSPAVAPERRIIVQIILFKGPGKLPILMLAWIIWCEPCLDFFKNSMLADIVVASSTPITGLLATRTAGRLAKIMLLHNWGH